MAPTPRMLVDFDPSMHVLSEHCTKLDERSFFTCEGLYQDGRALQLRPIQGDLAG